MARLSHADRQGASPFPSWSHVALRVHWGGVPDEVWRALEQETAPAVHEPLSFGLVVSDVGCPLLRVYRPPSLTAGQRWDDKTYRTLLTYDTHLVLEQLGRATTRHRRICDQARLVLARQLREGLIKRMGQHLDPEEEAIFLHLAVRTGGCPKGTRVCEWCGRVFPAQRAARCSACRDRGRARARAEHHTTVVFGRGEHRELQYVGGECAHPGCAVAIQSSDARVRYRTTHQAPSARVARHRYPDPK